MATFVKSISKREQWSWDGKEYVDGMSVQCRNNQFREDDRSFVEGDISPNANHGWSTAASDYYYLITKGSGIVEISNTTEFSVDRQIEITEGDSFKIPAGTTYNYVAGENGLHFALFMNNLWEE